MIIRSIVTILVFLLIIPVSGYSQNIHSEIKPGKDSTITKDIAFVVFEEDTLFTLSSSIGPFTPQERADALSNRLQKLAKELTFIEDSFAVYNIKGHSLINYKKTVLLSISDEDAIDAGHSRDYLAENYKEIIQLSLMSHFESKNLWDWFKRIGLTILTLAGLFLIFYLINRLFKWINTKLEQYEKSLKRKRTSFFRYLAPKGPEYFFIFLSNVVKIVLVILVLILYLPLLFSFLPWTKGIVEQFYAYIAAPVKFVLNGLINFLPNLFFIIIIILIARYFVRILSFASGEIVNEKLKIKGFHKDWAKPTLNILKIIIYAFALVFMFPYLPGSNSPAFQGVSIFLGVLFSLGSTSAIANIVAGIVITYMRPFTIGDRVKIGETIGDVTEKSLLVTKIKTLKNEDITIPNATIINAHLWNFTVYAKNIGLILHTSVTIGYDVEWKTVNELLLKAASKTKQIQDEPKPFVLQKSLDDNYVNYELNVYTMESDKMQLIYSDLHRNILEEFNHAGIEILSPKYVASRDGNKSTIPSPLETDTRNPIEKLVDKASGIDKQPPQK